MITPVQMLNEITCQIIESTSLLEMIYKNSNEDPEIDCAIRCLIRSLYKTKDNANEYINLLSK